MANLAHIQSNFVGGVASGSPAAFTNNVRAGNTLIVFAMSATSGNPTISDTRGFTWAQISTFYPTAEPRYLVVFYGRTGSTGTCSVTLTLAGATFDMIVGEYDGDLILDDPDAFNASQVNSSGYIVPSVPDAVIIGASGSTGAAATVGTNFNLRANSVNNYFLQIEDRIVSIQGPYDAHWGSTPGNFGNLVFALRNAAALSSDPRSRGMSAQQRRAA